MGGETPRELTAELLMVWELNPIKHQVIHIAISLAEGEHLGQEQKLQVVEKILRDFGYGNCPYHAREHHDGTKEHYHIAVSPITYEGLRVDRGGDRFQAKRTCRELERTLGLQQVSNQKTKEVEPPAPKAPAVQSVNLKDALYATILPAVKRCKTVGELARDLLLHGVQMEAGLNAKGVITSLGFRLSGTPGGYLNASAVHESFSITKLQKKHGLSYEPTRDNPHCAALDKKPLQPVQVVLEAAKAPPTSSPRIQESVEQVARHVLQSYRTRSSHAPRPEVQRDPAESTRRTPKLAPIPAPERPGLIAALLQARRAEGALPIEGGSRGPVQSLVGGREAASAALLPDLSKTVGAGIPIPVARLEAPEPTPGEAGPGAGVAPWNDPSADVDLSRPDPRGRGPALGPIEAGHADFSGAAAARARVHAADDHPSRRGPGHGLRPPRPGTSHQRERHASGSAHGPSGAEATPGARAGISGLGGIRGPRSLDWGTIEELMDEAREVLERLRPQNRPPSPRVPDPAAVASRMMAPRPMPSPPPPPAPKVEEAPKRSIGRR